jgi:APA family basic amino acid/polyamine antiporter
VALVLIAADALTNRFFPTSKLGLAERLALLSAVARLATYIGTAASVPVLRRKLPTTPRTFRVPGGPTIPIAALVVCLVFLSAAERRQLIAGLIACLVGALIYLTRRNAPPLPGTD